MLINKSVEPTPATSGLDAGVEGSGVAISDRNVDIGGVTGSGLIACVSIELL